MRLSYHLTKEEFLELQQWALKTKDLIIDLRDNVLRLLPYFENEIPDLVDREYLKFILKEEPNGDDKMKWKPIETAPRDGTPILACSPGYTEEFSRGVWPTTIFWGNYHPNSPGKPEWRDSSGHRRPHFTHWMPLPAEPKSEG